MDFNYEQRYFNTLTIKSHAPPRATKLVPSCLGLVDFNRQCYRRTSHRLASALSKKRHLAAKKTAQRLMASHQKPADAIELVRQAALCYFPREEIAQLTGKEWYEFLDSQLNQPVFIANYELWQQALYSKHPIQETHTLLQDCSLWIDQALPPKRKRRSARG